MREQHEQATLHGTMSQEPEGAPLSPSSPLRHVPDWDVQEGQCKGTGDMQGGAPPPLHGQNKAELGALSSGEWVAGPHFPSPGWGYPHP